VSLTISTRPPIVSRDNFLRSAGPFAWPEASGSLALPFPKILVDKFIDTRVAFQQFFRAAFFQIDGHYNVVFTA
jgi:hypothetical protein